MLPFVGLCLVLFIVFIVSTVGKTIIYTVKAIGAALVILAETLYRDKIINKNMRDESDVKHYIGVEQQKKIQKQIDIEQNKNRQHEKNMVYAILNKINEFNFKYPYADQYLVEEYKNNFYNMNIFQLQALEQKIISSHFRNVSDGNQTPNYTYADVEGLTPTETHMEFPVAMKLYRINTDYVLVINNLYAGSITMYQSKNYMPISGLCNAVLNRIADIKNSKANITSMNIDDIIKENNFDEIHKMREKNIIEKMNNDMKKD